jgi:hypothetical protein
MYAVAVPDASCPGCLGDGRCRVYPVLLDLVAAERAMHLTVPVRG